MDNQEVERLRKRLEEINSKLVGESVYIPELEYGIYLLIQEEKGKLINELDRVDLITNNDEEYTYNMVNIIREHKKTFLQK